MHSLLADLWTLVWPLAIGVGLFLSGTRLRRLPRAIRFFLVLFAMSVVILGGLSLARRLPLEVSWRLSDVGGASVLLCWVAMLLLGVVWVVPGRSFSSGFIAAIALLACFIIGIESAGRLWWRLAERQSWDRVVDDEGRLQQSSGATCSPTAAVMLLHLYGIQTSEGEMAYLAGTSLFGTDAPSIARALRQKVAALGWKVEIRHTNYDGCLELNRPFIAHVVGEASGHALLVEVASSDGIQYLDPADGQRKEMPRSEFVSIWDGTMVYLSGTPRDFGGDAHSYVSSTTQTRETYEMTRMAIVRRTFLKPVCRLDEATS